MIQPVICQEDKMKKIALMSLITALTAGCNTPPQSTEMTGNDRDPQGCILSAGYSWSALKQQCVQPFAIADIRLPDPENPALAIYVLLSEDRANAEIFTADLPESLILHSVKGGYVSEDKHYRLIQNQTGWELRKQPRS